MVYLPSTLNHEIHLFSLPFSLDTHHWPHTNTLGIHRIIHSLTPSSSSLYKSNGLSKWISILNRLTIVDGGGVMVGRGVLGRRGGAQWQRSCWVGRRSWDIDEKIMREREICKKIIFKYTTKKKKKPKAF